jgi:NAD(P)-dependent dehydrogenase (short-subunit alcohol dehydrogenase family)
MAESGASEMRDGEILVVGGTSGLSRDLAAAYARRGGSVVITSRAAERAEAAAAQIGGRTRGIVLDLARPGDLTGALSSVGRVDRLVLAAVGRDTNSVRDYRFERAVDLVTQKIVGYTEVVHALLDRLHDNSSILLFGGMAKERPYRGSTTVTSVNGAVTAMVRTFGLELAPIRVNAIHPGIVGDSPFWAGHGEELERVLERTPTRRLVAMADVTDAAVFLLENESVNGVNLAVDGGWTMT